MGESATSSEDRLFTKALAHKAPTHPVECAIAAKLDEGPPGDSDAFTLE